MKLLSSETGFRRGKLGGNLNLPSWVPDWQALSKASPESPILQTSGHFTTLKHIYRSWANGEILRESRVTSTGSLAAYGFQCAGIREVVHSNSWLPTDFLRYVRKRKCYSHSAQDITKQVGYQQSLSDTQIALRTIFMSINPLNNLFPLRLLDANNFNRTIGTLDAFFRTELSRCYNTQDFKELYGFHPQTSNLAGFVHDELLNESDRQMPRTKLSIALEIRGSLEAGCFINENIAVVISSHFQKIAQSTFCFQTSEGDIGIGPPQVSVGDQICVLSQCSFPVILRPVDDRYLYVGPCFMVGLMEGEASRTLEAEGVEPVEFDI
jgi:hypothetical protein